MKTIFFDGAFGTYYSYLYNNQDCEKASLAYPDRVLKIHKEYIETIAIQCRRSNITTASEAEEIAKKEKNKITKKLEKNTNKKVKADVPAWFSVKEEKEEMSKEEIKELEELLKDYR